MQKKVLIVEDESDLVKLLKYNLEKEGYKVGYATDGAVALAEARRDPPDIVILDLMLPGLDGLEVCRQLRRNDRFARTPILILSARSEEADRIVGLELGADDYVTKPFSTREVIARVRALLRRNEPTTPQRVKVNRGDISIDPTAHSVSVGGRSVELSALEFKLLHYMALHPEWCSRGTSFSMECGEMTARSRREASTSTCAVSAKKSKAARSSPHTCKPFTESAIVSLTAKKPEYATD